MAVEIRPYCEAHGGNPIPLDDQVTVLLPDGASYSGSDPRMIMFCDPPSEPVANLRARKRYYEAAIAFESRAFQKFKAECDQMDSLHLRYNGTTPPAPPNAQDILIKMQGRIINHQEQLAEIEAELEGTRSEIDRNEYAAEQVRRQQAVRDRMNQRAGILIQ